MTVENFLKIFSQKGWQMPNLNHQISVFANNPKTAFEFCDVCLNKELDTGILFDAMISYVCKADLQKLIEFAIHQEEIKNQNNQMVGKNTESLIAYTAYQYPELLHQHLQDILRLKINQESYYFSQPWHHLPQINIQIFKALFIQEQDLDKKYLLFTCLLATRHLPTIEWLLNTVRDKPFFIKIYGTLDEYLLAHLHNVGLTVNNDVIKSYCYPVTYHLVFDKIPSQSCVHFESIHPTWQMNAQNTSYAFGGVLQNDENLATNPLFHLITLHDIPNGIDVTLPKLVLACHISELNEGFDILFYQHDHDGNPKRIGEIQTQLNIIDKPLICQKIHLSQTPSRWQTQDWALSNGRENLNRLGGMPTWIQDAFVPNCPITGEKMSFLMQLDSGLLDVSGNSLLFGSGGICYVFWSNKARVSAFLMQCT